MTPAEQQNYNTFLPIPVPLSDPIRVSSNDEFIDVEGAAEADCENRPLIADEHTPFLMRSPVIRYVMDKFQPGSIKGSIFTLLTSTVGTGVLALPYAYKKTGLILSEVMLFVLAILAMFSLHCLLVSCRITKKKSYAEMGQHLYGNWARTASQITLILNLWGSKIGYLVVMKGIVKSQLNNIYPDHPDTIFFNHNFLMLVISILVVLPLGLLPRMGSVRFTSLFAFLSVIFMTCCVCVYYLVHGEQVVPHEAVLYADATKVMESLPFIIFVFICHQTVLPIYSELQRPSQRRMFKVIRRSIVAAFLSYTIIAVFVYLTFREETQSNFIKNDFHNEISIIIGSFGFCFSILMAIPVYMHAIRPLLDEVFLPGRPYSLRRLRWWATGVLITCLAIAYPVEDVGKVLGLLGSTTNPTLMFIFPTLYILRAADSSYKWTKIGAAVSCVIVVAMCAVSLMLQLKKIVTG